MLKSGGKVKRSFKIVCLYTIINAFGNNFCTTSVGRLAKIIQEYGILYRVRQNYGSQGLTERYKFNSLSALNLTRG